MPRFRILQASDFHLAAKPYQYGLPDSWWDVIHFRCSPRLVSSQDLDIERAFARFAASLPPDGIDYDVLVASGDMATTGQPADLARARSYVTTPYAPMPAPAGLGASPATINLMPGNHDRYGPPPAGVFHRPGNIAFDQPGAFGPYWGVGARVYAFEPITKQDIQLVLIGADLTLAAIDMGNWLPFGWCGQGRAYPGRVQALRESTQTARQQAQAQDLECCVIWVIHFIPFDANDFLQLLDASRLLTAAREEEIPLVLCGHTHEPSQLLHHPSTPATHFCLCGSTTQYHQLAGNYLNLIDLDLEASPSASQVHLRPHKYHAQRLDPAKPPILWEPLPVTSATISF